MQQTGEKEKEKKESNADEKCKSMIRLTVGDRYDISCFPEISRKP